MVVTPEGVLEGLPTVPGFDVVARANGAFAISGTAAAAFLNNEVESYAAAVSDAAIIGAPPR